jgi:hypothetical protein
MDFQASSMDEMGVTGFRSQRRPLVAALVVSGSLLAGCSSPSLPSTSSFSSLFGSKQTAAADSNAQAIYTPPANFECPDVTVRQGAATLSSSADAAEPTALNLRYQVTIGNTARECRVVGGTVTLKVGMQGRIILGPQGSPGTVDVPVRFAVVREGVEPKTINTKLTIVPVTVPPGDGNVLFSHVEEGLDFPMPKGKEIDSYVIYVGFDPIGVQQQRRKPASPARHRRGT